MLFGQESGMFCLTIVALYNPRTRPFNHVSKSSTKGIKSSTHWPLSALHRPLHTTLSLPVTTSTTTTTTLRDQLMGLRLYGVECSRSIAIKTPL